MSKIIIDIENIGFIEDVYAPDEALLSFNVYSRLKRAGHSDFYKSAYNIDKAKKYLDELVEKSKSK